MTTVILVPRRSGFADRDRLWAWCRAWWEREFPDLPIYIGHHNEGLFNRSAALNTASRLAGDWTTALIIDSDVFAHPPAIREAIDLSQQTGRIVVPFEIRHNLSANGTGRILAGYQGQWHPLLCRAHFKDQHSSILAVPRDVWDATGGFDEEFRGWGMEDTSWVIAVNALGYEMIHLPGDVWHLNHHSAPEKHGSAPTERNRARMERYRAAAAAGGWAAVQRVRDTPEEAAETSIPRILHRTVPRETSDQVERWWSEFDALHPGWQLMTHRDPLEPSEWPLTSPHWHRCKAGAQLADLIRLEALWRWGGFYVDSDMQPFRSLDPLLPLEVVAAWEDANVIPNAFIGARRGHHLIRACLDLCIRRLDRGIWKAGPGVTTEVFRDNPSVLALPAEAVYPVDYRDPERQKKMERFDPAAHPATFMMHWYAYSWKGK